MLCDCMFLYRNVVRTNIESYYQLSTDYFSYKLTSSGDVFLFSRNAGDTDNCLLIYFTVNSGIP